MTMKLLGIAGAKGVGKDTFYNILKSRLHAVQRAAFADCLKADIDQLPGLEGASKEQIRGLLQDYGTAAKELQGRDYWLDRVEPYLEALDPNKVTVVTDVRYAFEAEWVKRQGGKIVTITRPVEGSADSHSSETEWKNIVPDYTIANASTRAAYADSVLAVYLEAIKQ